MTPEQDWLYDVVTWVSRVFIAIGTVLIVVGALLFFALVWQYARAV